MACRNEVTYQEEVQLWALRPRPSKSEKPDTGDDDGIIEVSDLWDAGLTSLEELGVPSFTEFITTIMPCLGYEVGNLELDAEAEWRLQYPLQINFVFDQWLDGQERIQAVLHFEPAGQTPSSKTMAKDVLHRIYEDILEHILRHRAVFTDAEQLWEVMRTAMDRDEDENGELCLFGYAWQLCPYDPEDES
ncbi:hypothetical protein MMC29_003703 [Sticta canariensis]|nr:hypothetical protein [Sticta canariensis]